MRGGQNERHHHHLNRLLLGPGGDLGHSSVLGWLLVEPMALKRECPECVAVLAAVAALVLMISGMAGLLWLSHWLAA